MGSFPNLPEPNYIVMTFLIRYSRRNFGKIGMPFVAASCIGWAGADAPVLLVPTGPNILTSARCQIGKTLIFKRKGLTQPITKEAAHYLPGDLVTCTVAGKLPHIVVISDRKNAAGVPLIIHNIGHGAREEDRLFEFPINGHFRWK